MKLEQAAAILQMDLKTTIARFGGNQKLFLRFLTRLPGDETFPQLRAAMEKGDWKAVENSAHTLKGVAANLGLEELRSCCDAMVTAVRQDQTQQLPELFEKTASAFEISCDVIGQLEEQ